MSSSVTVTTSSTSSRMMRERQVARPRAPRCRRRSSGGWRPRRGCPAAQRRRVGRGVLRLHADDPDGAALRGGTRLDGGGDAGDQAAAADAQHDGVEVGQLVHELEAERALAGDHVAVVEGVDEDGAGALGELRRPAAAASRPSRPPGRRRRRSRAWRASLGTGTPSGMKIVARMPSALAASATPCAWLPAEAATTPRAASSGGQPRQAVGRAADLERAGALQVLELEVDGHAEQRRERCCDSSSGVCTMTPRGTAAASSKSGERRRRLRGGYGREVVSRLRWSSSPTGRCSRSGRRRSRRPVFHARSARYDGDDVDEGGERHREQRRRGSRRSSRRRPRRAPPRAGAPSRRTP